MGIVPFVRSKNPSGTLGLALRPRFFVTIPTKGRSDIYYDSKRCLLYPTERIGAHLVEAAHVNYAVLFSGVLGYHLRRDVLYVGDLFVIC